eukprot:1472722-Prymnesium_polylepis.1
MPASASTEHPVRALGGRCAAANGPSRAVSLCAWTCARIRYSARTSYGLYYVYMTAVFRNVVGPWLHVI